MGIGKPKTPLTQEEYDQAIAKQRRLGMALSATGTALKGGDPFATVSGIQKQYAAEDAEDARIRNERTLNASIDALDIPETQKNFYKQLSTPLKSQAVMQSFKQQPRKTVQQGGIHYYIDTGKPVLNVDAPADDGDDTAAIQNYEYAQNITDPGLKNQFLAITGALKYDPTAMAKLEESKQKAKSGGLLLTPGQEKLDDRFTITAEKWLASGSAQADANLANIENKIARLYSGEENLSGPGFAFIPERLRPVLAPAAAGFLDDISELTYQSLRETLGAQFTQREAERLVNTSFNISLPEEQNVNRLQRLKAKLESIKQNRNNQIAFFMEKGTLQGYEKEDVTFDNILDSVLFDEYKSMTSEEVLNRYKEAPTTEEKQSILRYAKLLKEQESGGR
ncbi:MAG: hypothetical protein HOM38_08235 [Euryarchaeota archaeon]|nr:hypothetical protein [Euryarchaeota archaeon]